MRALILSVFCAVSPLVASAAARTAFEEGQELLRRMEDARAADAFRRALARPGISPAERARILVHLGIAHCNLLDWTAAEQAFRRALADQPDVRLPAVTSPHIVVLFERLRASASRPASAPAASRPEARRKPASLPAATRPRPASVVRLSLPLPRADHERSWRRAWGAWATLGLAVVAAGTGLALRLVARSEEERANDLGLTYEEAMGHYDSARSQAIAADVLLGVAAAAAVVSGVLFYRHARGGRSQAPRVVVGGSGLGVAAW